MKNSSGSIVGIAVFGLALIPIFYTTIFHNHFVFTKTAVLTFLVLLLLGTKICKVLFRGQLKVPDSRAFRFIAIWVLWLALTMLWASVTSLAIRSWVLRLVFLFLFYFFATEKIDWKWILPSVAFSSFAVSVFALLQYYGVDYKFLPSIQLTGVFDLGNLVLIQRPENTLKIYSTFGHRNYLSGYLILGIPLWVSLAILRFSQGSKLFRDKDCWRSYVPRLFGALGFLCLAALTSYVVLLTRTRGAIGGLVVSTLFLSLFLAFRSGLSLKGLLSKCRYFIGVVFLIVGLALYGGVFSPLTEALGNKFSASFDLSRGSSGHRYLIWQAAWRIITSSPANFLAGTGPGSFQVNHVEATESLFNSSSSLYQGSADVIVRSWFVHNEYLNVWLDSGIVGLGFFLSFLFFLFRDGFYSLLKKDETEAFILGGIFFGMVAFVIHNFVSFSCQLPSAGSLFFIFGGILVYRQGTDELVSLPGSPIKKRAVAFGLAVLLCAGPALMLFASCAGEYYWRQALVEEGKGNLEKALYCYDKALLIEGNYPELFRYKGDFLFRQKRYTEAMSCFRQFVQFVPDIETHYRMALCCFELRRAKEGMSYLELTLRENPRHERALLLQKTLLGKGDS